MSVRARRCIVAVAGCVLLAAASLAAQEPQPAPPTASDTARAAVTDSLRRAVFQRAQRLVNDGSGAEGRALMDSLLNATEPGSAAEADVLFWRASLAESWEAAQRDYLRITLEHERSARSGAALLRLAQGELARGDRDGALKYLERLDRETPASPVRGEAGLWHGRLLIERGSGDAGCTILRSNREFVARGALELENQYDFLLRGCAAATGAASAGAVPSASAPSVPPPPRPSSAPSRAVPPSADSAMAPRPTRATTLVWTVQIAAFPTAAEARKFAEEIRARGYDTRVDGTSAPFRVRFGRYESRDAATAAMNAYKQKERSDAFLAQVPRE